MDLIPLLPVFQYTGIGVAKHLLVETFAEALLRLLHLFLYLVVELRQVILDQHIGAVSFFAFLVVNQRVVERIHMSRCLPDGGVHKDGRVDAHHVLVQQHHAVPPIFLDVVFELHTHLTVVIHSAQPVIDLARLKHVSIFLAV